MRDIPINKKKWALGFLLLFVIVILLFLLIKHYQLLGKTIEEERTTYISEIKNQLVKNIREEKLQQITLVNLYGQALLQLQPQGFYEVNRLLSHRADQETKDEVFLVDTKGRVYTTDGKEKNFSTKNLLYDLAIKRKEIFGYSQINQGEEYWIYGAPLPTMQVEDVEICAVINARSVSTFSERMSTGFMDKQGFSYIMSKNGNILVFPSAENFMGFNLFHTLEGYGADGASIEKMKLDFVEGKEGKQVLFFDDNKWLLDYSGDLFDDWVVVVMMPVTITGADTYKMLNGTAILVLLLFFSIIVLMLFIIQSFYRRERTRERLLQQEKANLVIAQKIAESKNSFLAKMSHDIRTPLNAIIGLLQITAGSVSDRPKAAENLNQAGKAAEYLLNVLNDILDMAKIESGKMDIRKAAFSFYELIETLKVVNTSQANAKQIEFEVRIEGAPSGYYLGDRVRISQVLMNLLSNAVKFTEKSGSILFAVKAEPQSDETDRLTFIVQDDGIGMSEQYLERLFQPFEQETETQSKNNMGSGLGLSIVKNLVDLMGGSIDVTSQKGKGSCFTIALTLEKTEKPEEPEQIPAEEANLKGKSVLLVEDNELNAMIAEEILATMCGMSVKTARNGREAVDLFQESCKGEFDLILMDIRMPVMNGLEATREIRKLSRPDAGTIPIIAMSANAFDDDIAAAYDSGMNEYLSKPVDVQKMTDTLRKFSRKG